LEETRSISAFLAVCVCKITAKNWNFQIWSHFFARISRENVKMRTCDSEIKEGSMHFLPFILTLSASLRVGMQAYYRRNKLRKKDIAMNIRVQWLKKHTGFLVFSLLFA
jgi:hypothetical protein